MRHINHLVRARRLTPILQMQGGEDDYLVSMIGVGGAYHPKLIGDGSEVRALTEDTSTETAFRKSQDELRQLSSQLLNIQEWERQRIAADLHDGLGQSLSLIKLSIESVSQQMKTGAYRKAAESLQQVILKIKDTMAELHRTTMDMRPSMLDDLGILPTLSWFFREFEVAWGSGKVEKDFAIKESDVPVLLKTVIFRITQEAMNNIVKHACADSIRVSLKMSDGTLRLSIEDNGRGFDPDEITIRHGSDRGFGLLTMKERARTSDGLFEMRTAPGHGTQIVISWRPVKVTVSHGAVEPHGTVYL